MTTAQTLILGSIAGSTIFIGPALFLLYIGFAISGIAAGLALADLALIPCVCPPRLRSSLRLLIDTTLMEEPPDRAVSSDVRLL